MHPYLVERAAQERWETLSRLAAAAGPVDPFSVRLRTRVGEALVSLGRRIAGTHRPPACTMSTCSLSTCS